MTRFDSQCSEVRRYQIGGVVQGVGFRPFVYREAARNRLGGWVRNDSDGVLLEVQGPVDALEAFIEGIRANPPALARVDSIALLERRECERALPSFEIKLSERSGHAHTLVPVDTCVCEECVAELLDPANRRHRYPYINCTNCGPRYSIVRAVPYDRPNTTMADFPLCAECDREYGDIRDRRFHAQPIACWACGPRVALVHAGQAPPRAPQRAAVGAAAGAADFVAQAARLLREGAIVAVKGIGGYHLMVDARDERALAELRRRKRRDQKPFALMVPSVQAARELASVDDHESSLLSDPRRPIVLLRKRAGEDGLAAAVAPGNRRYGLMLAYTPIHHLLFADGLDALVATSGNVSEEPIAFRDDDALERLAGVADAFLIGERDIFTRVDDSILAGTRLAGRSHTISLRRARGWTPEPISAPFELEPLLAVGPELKNTICLARGSELFLSHHIGDLSNATTMRSFEHAIEHLCRLLEVSPRLVAHDLHPDYMSTGFALAERGVQTVAVQHHHAHMAACMCEHGLTERALGVVFDGTGHGSDGNAWGGEFLLGDLAGFERAAHLRYFRLPGGDRAAREPFRVALSLLHQAGIERFEALDLPPLRGRAVRELRAWARMIASGLHSPLTSSMGRLFDGVAALIGVRQRCRYEAQAAIELEQLIDPDAVAEPLPWGLGDEDRSWPWPIDPAPTVRELVRLLALGETDTAELSLRFHCTVVEMVRRTCESIRRRSGVSRVLLSGGVFQNEFLLRRCEQALRTSGFDVYAHTQVPSNDGGVAIGQAVVAGWSARARGVAARTQPS